MPFYAVHDLDQGKKHLLVHQRRREYTEFAIAGFAIGVQYACMYVTSYFHKTGKEWTTTGDATWYALQLDFFRTFAGDILLNFPAMLRTMTTLVLWWEGFGFLFWYMPFFTGILLFRCSSKGPLRTFGVIAFSLMHFGFGLALRLGLFASIGMFGVLILLPNWFWERIVFQRLRTKQRVGFRLYYFPHSKLSSIFASTFEHLFLIPESQVIPMESESEIPPKFSSDEVVVDIQPKRNVALSSWLMVRDWQGVHHTNFNAFVSLCHVSPLLWPLYHILKKNNVLSKIIHRIFLWLNANSLGASSPPPKRPSEASRLFKRWRELIGAICINVFLLFTLIFVLRWNAPALRLPQLGLAPAEKGFAYLTHLDQGWA